MKKFLAMIIVVGIVIALGFIFTQIGIASGLDQVV